MKVDLIPFLYATSHKPQATSHKPQATSHKPKSLISAFTLIELMVVIGIIGILSSIAIPFVKKAYSDFKINETYWLLDSLFSSQRAYYLIYNEPHGCKNGPGGGIDESLFFLLAPRLRKLTGNRPTSPTDYGGGAHYWYTFWLYQDLYLCKKLVYTYFVCGRVFTFYKEYRGYRVIDDLYYLDDLLERFQEKGYNAYQNVYDEVCFDPPEWRGYSTTLWFE